MTGVAIKWDASTNRIRLNTGVPITFVFYKGWDVVRRSEGFFVLLSHDSNPSVALRHQGYLLRLQGADTDNFNFAFKIYENQSTLLYRLFTDFNQYYVAYDSSNEEFRIEPPGDSTICEFSINRTLTASEKTSLPVTQTMQTVRIGSTDNIGGVQYLWILKAGLVGVGSNYNQLLGLSLLDDINVEVTLDYLYNSNQMSGSDPSVAYITSQSAAPAFTYKSKDYPLYVYNI